MPESFEDSNFFSEGGYYRNTIVREKTAAELLAALNDRMEVNIKKPGAVEFAMTCKDRGLPVAVASGADRIKVLASLEEVGMPGGLFTAIVDGNDVARKKPAPDIFLEACRRIGLPARECLVVEDAVSGVAAAKAAGARCLGITTSFDATQLAQADWTAPDLAHVPPDALAW